MYRVIGREIVNGRNGRFLVEISREWPSSVHRIYLISTLTSLYPGYRRLVRRGDRGYIVLKTWPGTYGYGFVLDNVFDQVRDPENNEEICIDVPFHPDEKMCLSRLEVRRPENPLDDIYHLEYEPGFAHRFLDTIVLRFMSRREIDHVVLETDQSGREPIARHDLGDYVVYEYHVPFRDIVRYRFRFNYRGETLYYGFNGIGSNPQPFILSSKYLPGLNKPKWYMGTVYYQIFIDSFRNGDPSNDPPVKIKSTAPREYGYYGGDLRGVIESIDYLEDLGVETIYLTPIYKSTSYHRYDVIDYKSIDKYLGSMDDFVELTRKLHSRGMKLVLDITFNHTSPCNELFVDALVRGEESRYWSWFSIVEKPPREFIEEFIKYLYPECRIREYLNTGALHGKKPFFEGFFNSWTMVKFNHENFETLEYFFLDVTSYWIKHGVDGFRVDVAMGIDQAWLLNYYLAVKNVEEDFLVLGEVSEPPLNYVCCFDSVMNYWLRMIVLNTLVYHRYGLEEFIHELNKTYALLPYHYILSLYNMLGSHDTARIKTLVSDQRVLELMYTLLFILPGSPAVYYGDEIGLEGGRDPDNRRPMIWDSSRWDKKLYEHVKRLISIRRRYKVLRLGFYELKKISDSVLLVKRWFGNQVFYGLVNMSNRDVAVKNNMLNGEFTNIYSEEKIKLDGELNIKPYGYSLLLKTA